MALALHLTEFGDSSSHRLGSSGNAPLGSPGFDPRSGPSFLLLQMCVVSCGTGDVDRRHVKVRRGLFKSGCYNPAHDAQNGFVY
jgi:hypothetical protein